MNASMPHVMAQALKAFAPPQSEVHQILRTEPCTCDAYRFPHRAGGGKCEPAEGYCAICSGTGLGKSWDGGWCSSCGGSGK